MDKSKSMKPAIFVHTPAHLLENRLAFLLNRNLQPEVACQEVSIEQLDLASLKDCAQQLADKNLATTLHAPFSGFNPGSAKKRLQKAAHSLCQQSLQLAEVISASRVVFHPGIPYQATEKVQQKWLQNALGFWPDYIEQAARIGTQICMENIYESSSEVYRQLFAELGSDHFTHCFDIGHWNIFADEPLQQWFETLGRHVTHLHLHDNLGQNDQHLPIGTGNIDFSALLEQLATLPSLPSMTLEAHTLPELEKSLLSLSRLLSR